MNCPCCLASLAPDLALLNRPGITLLKKDILLLWTAGWEQKDIAVILGRSRWCVHSHVDQACRALGVRVDQRAVTLWLYGLEGKPEARAMWVQGKKKRKVEKKSAAQN